MLALSNIWEATNIDNNVIGLAATLVALGVLWRYIVRPYRKARKTVRENWVRVVTAIDLVEHELKPNSGMTLRDSADRTEAKVDHILGKVDLLENNQNDMLSRLQHLEGLRESTTRTRSTDPEVTE